MKTKNVDAAYQILVDRTLDEASPNRNLGIICPCCKDKDIPPRTHLIQVKNPAEYCEIFKCIHCGEVCEVR